MNNVWTVYFREPGKLEYSMHFTKEEDANKFMQVAERQGCFAYVLNESVYSEFSSWMNKYFEL